MGGRPARAVSAGRGIQHRGRLCHNWSRVYRSASARTAATPGPVTTDTVVSAVPAAEFLRFVHRETAHRPGRLTDTRPRPRPGRRRRRRCDSASEGGETRARERERERSRLLTQRPPPLQHRLHRPSCSGPQGPHREHRGEQRTPSTWHAQKCACREPARSPQLLTLNGPHTSLPCILHILPSAVL